METQQQIRTPHWLQLSPGAQGISLCLVAGCVACLLLPVPAAGALAAGVIVALVFGNPVASQTVGAANLVLKLAIVALGAGMNLDVVLRIGAASFGYTAAGVAGTLALGLWLGRRAGVSPSLALLLSAGTAICGGSAIAAVSGAIRTRAQEIPVALAVIFLLNAIALFIFPPIGRMLGFLPEQFGLWAALAVHDTSSVVGAASAYGGGALGVAVTVKLVRALWIVPVTIAARLYCGSRNGRSLQLAHFCPPVFILGYLLMAAIFTWLPFAGLDQLAPAFTQMGHRGMAVALFLIGTGLSRAALRQAGLRPLGVAAALWVVVSIGYAVLLKAGYIH